MMMMMMMDVAKIQNSDEKTMKDDDNDDGVVLPGFRFHPTDEELVGFYLRRKVEKKLLRIELIKHVDIYKYDPWDLPKVSSVGEKEWYFFCMRGRKYRNSIRPNRVTGSGFWKATGIDKPIYSSSVNSSSNKEQHECIIGLKKSLVYYRGSAGKGTKTDWMMHEFRLPPSNHHNAKINSSSNNIAEAANKDLQEAEVWTLCRIFKRIPSYKKYTPNLKDSSSSASQVNTRPNKTNSSSSKSCSLESDNSKPYFTFKDSSMAIHQNERKPVIIGHVDERNNINNNHLFLGQLDHVSQAPTTLTYSNWNQDVEDLFGNENWDDLRSVVQFATDPSNVYDCRDLNRF